MTDDIKAIRDALAAGPRLGEWTTGNMDPLLFGLKQGHGIEPLGFVYGPALIENSAYGRQCLATAAYIASVHPERIARLLDALEAATRDAERYRWLRDSPDADPDILRWADDSQRAAIDADVDAAMAQSPEVAE